MINSKNTAVETPSVHKDKRTPPEEDNPEFQDFYEDGRKRLPLTDK